MSESRSGVRWPPIWATKRALALSKASRRQGPQPARRVESSGTSGSKRSTRSGCWRRAYSPARAVVRRGEGWWRTSRRRPGWGSSTRAISARGADRRPARVSARRAAAASRSRLARTSSGATGRPSRGGASCQRPRGSRRRRRVWGSGCSKAVARSGPRMAAAGSAHWRRRA